MKRDLDQFRHREFDLLVIGGGITGAGAALDAAARGLQVALVEKGDFAGGTSSVSSKLVHGGFRYLEHGQFRWVRESLQERRCLLANAPHLVQPLAFVVPIYQDSRVPRWKLRLGLTCYDWLAGEANLGRSRPLTCRVIKRAVPWLRTEGLIGGAGYWDAQMEDARLCLEVVATAAASGACVANYLEVVGFQYANGLISGAAVVDRLSQDRFFIGARQVLNASGPWVSSLCRLARDSATAVLRPTKGVHVILPGLGLSAALLLFHPRDGRVFFVIPWLRRTLVGTTDTECDESPDHLSVCREDIDYLLEGLNHFFRSAPGPEAVINTFAGLRPLLAAEADGPSALPREHRIFRSSNGLLSVAGGKYTTYRLMAEEIVDEVERALGKRSYRRGATRRLKLHGVPDEDWPRYFNRTWRELERSFAVSPVTAQHLVRRYGSYARAVAAYVAKDKSLAAPIIAGEPDLSAELAYQRDQEMAIYPDDHLLRRTRLGLFHPELLNYLRSPLGRG